MHGKELVRNIFIAVAVAAFIFVSISPMIKSLSGNTKILLASMATMGVALLAAALVARSMHQDALRVSELALEATKQTLAATEQTIEYSILNATRRKCRKIEACRSCCKGL